MYFSPKENTCFACWDLSASFNILTMQHDQQKNLLSHLESFDTSEVLNGFNSFLFCKHLICIPVECGDKSEHPLAFYLIREVCCRGFWKMSNEHKKVGANVIKLKIWWGKDEKMVYHPWICISWIFMSCSQPNKTGMKGVRLQKFDKLHFWKTVSQFCFGTFWY